MPNETRFGIGNFSISPAPTLETSSAATVTATFDVLDDGTPNVLPALIGHRLLQGAVADALKTWRFSKDAVGEQVEVTFEFALNCPKESNQN
jgi:hypothetical protein